MHVQPFQISIAENPILGLFSNCTDESGQAAQINVSTDWCRYHQCRSDQFVSLWRDIYSAYIIKSFLISCISVLANPKKSWEGGDKNILRAGKGDLSDKCGHLPSSNHLREEQLWAKQLFTATKNCKKNSWFCWQGQVSPCLHWQEDRVASSRNRFLVDDGSGGDASQRFCCQPVMTLLDTIGHLARLTSIVSPTRDIFVISKYLNLMMRRYC